MDIADEADVRMALSLQNTYPGSTSRDGTEPSVSRALPAEETRDILP